MSRNSALVYIFLCFSIVWIVLIICSTIEKTTFQTVEIERAKHDWNDGFAVGLQRGVQMQIQTIEAKEKK